MDFLAAITVAVAAPPAPVIDVAKLAALVFGIVQVAKQYIPAGRGNRASDVRVLATAVAVVLVLLQTYLPALAAQLGLALSIAGASMLTYQAGSKAQVLARRTPTTMPAPPAVVSVTSDHIAAGPITGA